MQGSFRIIRIAGFDIRVHYTWLFAFVLVTWTLAQGFFPLSYPGWDAPTYWATAAVAALLLFASVLVHEVAHSIVARLRGIGVRDITLFIFGGVSNVEEEAKDAWDELRISAVGPLTSMALAGVFYGLSQITGPRNDPLAAIADYLALVNLMVAAFNLLPGFPLDGGRVLRSLIWMGTKDFVRATRVATMVGQVFAFLFIIGGVFLALSGNFLNGIWIAFIGWFLNSAADASRRDVETREAFRGVRVEVLMGATPETVTADVSIDELVHNRFLAGGRRALPVLRDGRLEGIVTVTDVKKGQRDAWASTRVGDIMTREPLHTVRPDSELTEALGLMAEKDLNQVLVMKDGALVGLLSRADIIRYLQYRSELGIPPAKTSGERTPRP